MCAVETLKLMINILVALKLGIGIYLCIAGGYLASELRLQMGYSVWFIGAGTGIIILALMSMFISGVQMYAVKRHNRFLLVVCFLIDTVVLISLLATSNNVSSFMVPEFPKDLQQDCLLNEPQKYSHTECKKFYEADRTAGFRLVWELLFSERADPLRYQILTTIQLTDSGCCGFFQPMKCTNNTSPFPGGKTISNIESQFIGQRVTCGPYPGFYPQQQNCLHYYDYAHIPPIIGGCIYDLGIGDCLDTPYASTSAGCASVMEDYMGSLISSHVTGIAMSSLMNLVCMLISCCMWWKRKEEDVFPDFLSEKNSVNVNYFKVQEQFEIRPHQGILVDQGYLPNTDHDIESEIITTKVHRQKPQLITVSLSDGKREEEKDNYPNEIA